MKKAVIFFLGFLVGIFFTILAIFLISKFFYSQKPESEISSQKETEKAIQYMEIKGKKGNVTLHTGMLKDSVQILIGKPDNLDLREGYNRYYETWGYKINNRYVADLYIDFENGKLISIQQN